MKVTLIAKTVPTFGESMSSDVVAYTAAKQCYSESFNPFEDDIPDNYTETLERVLGSGHTSVSENMVFTFLIEGVSRVLTHQLVRQRIASFAQQSQRYVRVVKLLDNITIPPSISNNPKALEIFLNLHGHVEKAYNELVELEIPKEDARFTLTNATNSNIVVSMNARALSSFFGHRLCERAQWEIRDMAQKMADICKRESPCVFVDAKFGYPKCVQDGTCREHKSCGKCKLKNKEYEKDILKGE